MPTPEPVFFWVPVQPLLPILTRKCPARSKGIHQPSERSLRSWPQIFSGSFSHPPHLPSSLRPAPPLLPSHKTSSQCPCCSPDPDWHRQCLLLTSFLSAPWWLFPIPEVSLVLQNHYFQPYLCPFLSRCSLSTTVHGQTSIKRRQC